MLTLTGVAVKKKKKEKKMKIQAATIIDAVKKPSQQMKLAAAIREGKGKNKKGKKMAQEIA